MVKQERAGRTRQAVLLAAADAFAEAGFEAANLVDISRRAGVSKGALYFHFVSKQALADGVRAAAAREIGSAALRARRAGGPALQGLIDFSHELARLLREDVLVRAGVQLGQGARFGAGAAWRSLTEVFRRLLDRAADAGELHPGVDLRQAADLLTTLAAGLVLFAPEDAGRLRPEAVRGLWAAALPALVPADRCSAYRT
ncbi:ScbR family autoregulator-binding transcription factor [Kitasatospora sp. CM 4170]|uniref:ScbR family autoregulator-binding transcription factor n=1 Tax=Kitasatospora aburaviensis TaxID=67265 RepID=A0ABW1EZB9_9ACTN|nr:ScbR family autoregulator-binding transcription factor [Kitasatospora sp. CM 4170]WNM46378.1 ScbR family autoregulator-binding transcription factor [Kitasatospora sp. CM 4170]